jgi:arylsulfatase A-like enzyme
MGDIDPTSGFHPNATGFQSDRKLDGPRYWPALFRQNGYHTAQIGKWHAGSTSPGQARSRRVRGGRRLLGLLSAPRAHDRQAQLSPARP